MPSRAHDDAARKIAKKVGGEYNKGKGVDVPGRKATVEVETPGTVKGGMRQLQGHRGPVFIAGTNEKAVKKALKVTKGTTVGVMNKTGKVIKRSTVDSRTA